jgi:ubiquinone/menaquinone biosynthesis C-methylase UbiE
VSVGIHRTAAVGFDRAADAYERGRPDYAPEAVEWLKRELWLGRDSVVVDLAAGTGKLSRLLAASDGPRVIAIEPVEGMRAALDAGGPGLEVLDGRAEAIPLEDASVDALTVAQAFHWFDGKRALAEIHRVLRPGGRLALVWNVRNLDQPLQAALEEIVDRHRGSTPAHRKKRWRKAFEQTLLFEPAGTRSFPHRQALDIEGLVARVASISFIAALPAGEHDEVLSAVRRLGEEYGPHPDLEYETEIELFARTEREGG